jgi:hypothetical protein
MIFRLYNKTICSVEMYVAYFVDSDPRDEIDLRPDSQRAVPVLDQQLVAFGALGTLLHLGPVKTQLLAALSRTRCKSVIIISTWTLPRKRVD